MTYWSPRVGHVFDRWGGAAGAPDGHQVKPILVSGTSVAEHPHGSHPGNVALLAPADRFEAGSADRGAPSLHLDKGHRPAFSDHEIDIVPAELEAMSLDRPAARREEGYGGPLPVHTEQLALVFPFVNRNEAAAVSHGPG